MRGLLFLLVFSVPAFAVEPIVHEQSYFDKKEEVYQTVMNGLAKNNYVSTPLKVIGEGGKYFASCVGMNVITIGSAVFEFVPGPSVLLAFGLALGGGREAEEEVDRVAPGLLIVPIDAVTTVVDYLEGLKVNDDEKGEFYKQPMQWSRKLGSYTVPLGQYTNLQCDKINAVANGTIKAVHDLVFGSNDQTVKTASAIAK
jgi:hypothetical protein